MRRILTWLLLSTSCLSGSVALAQSGPSFPALTGRVVDQAGLLNASQEQSLDQQLAAHEAATSNQVVIVTVSALEGYDIADYANRLGRSWQIGTEEKNNGVLLVVAPTERKVRIEVGYGLEGALTDALSGQIIRREILPKFRNNDYPGGIDTGVDSIIKAIEGEYKLEPKEQRKDDSAKFKTIIPLFFIAMVGGSEGLRRSGRKRIANMAMPAGFGGLMATVISGNVIIGILAGLGLFAGLFLFNRGKNNDDDDDSGGKQSRVNRGVTGGFAGGSLGGMSGGFGGGGGFSGGGGGFGGGGSSGGW